MIRGLLMGGLLLAVFAGCSPVGPAGAPRVLPEVQSMLTFAAYPGAVTEENAQPSYSGGGGFLGTEPANYGMRVQRTTDTPETILAHYKRLAAQNGWEYGENIVSPNGPCGVISYNAYMNVSRYSLRFEIVSRSRYANAGRWQTDPCPISPPPMLMPTPGPEGAAPSPEATPSPQPTSTPQVFWYIEQNAQVSR